MTIRSRLRSALAPALKQHRRIWQQVLALDRMVERLRHGAAVGLPILIRPEPRRIEIAITAHCNLRCIGCRYGRDFMPGKQLAWPLVRDLLDDAAEAGIWCARFYGGEPLLHPELPRMIAHATELGMDSYVTTNGMLLERRMAELHAAGLRHLSIGFYGTDERYDRYVQRPDRFAKLEAGVASVRDRYGESVAITINWLLMRPSCHVADLHAAVAFARRHALRIQVDLVHYSLPYFSEGPQRELQFRAEDRPQIELVVAELLSLKDATPELFNQSRAGLASIPDWLVHGPGMRLPCDSYQSLWVGADGTVQQCYVQFRLGNLHEQRLARMLFTAAHRQAARDAVSLRCPNCHCRYDLRVEKHAASAARYGKPAAHTLARSNEAV